MLVIFHILEDGRLDSDVEIVTLVGTDRHKAGAHLEAVHLARDAAVHVSDLVVVEIVAGRSRKRPVLSGADVGVKAQVLSPTAIILQFVVIE